MKSRRTDKLKAFLIVGQVLAITALHYGTGLSEHHYHIFYRELYYLPVMLAAFWFGLKGALWTSLSISGFYFPFIMMHWQQFSPDDFNKVMEILLYNLVGLTLGLLSDRKKAEHEELLKSESLAAMGKAISSVAHDMKTPLIAIGGFTRMVQRRLDKDDPSFEKLRIVMQETERLENMVKQMLHFAKPLELDLAEGDVNAVIEQSLVVLENSGARRDVSIVTELDLSIPLLSMDAAKMEQVILNLIFNAVQASSDGEVVRVKSSVDDQYIKIDIIDCGCGIPDDKKDQIFMPFYTTKKEGTGLGLAIVKKIVEAHDGRLDFQSNPGGGVTFSVSLPLSKA
ncbi:MAG: ATP-binding protein [Desulfocapsaceae bacterium]|jgi:signal transduction histidine kinase|nr:ATP-binding protein [Desulfocapsaceae bacterium]